MEGDGFDLLRSALEGESTDALTLVGVVLRGGKERGWSWDRAWMSAINRVQGDGTTRVAWLTAPYGTVSADARLERLYEAACSDADLEEWRQLIDEDRFLLQALYEGRAPTLREKAVRMARIMQRVDAPVAA